jgi:hypothetical protein
MATMAYAKKNFEDDFIVVYEFGETRAAGPVGNFVISKAEPRDWHIFAEPYHWARAESTAGKGLRLFRETGEWPPGVSFNS